ncbi:MAG: PEGA domain-containing protein [Acidobacteriota bacterium]
MRLRTVCFATVLVVSLIVLSPGSASAQHRRGGHGGSSGIRGPVVWSVGGGGGGGGYWGSSYDFGIGWGYPRWWYPVGYGPYWYNPYWYGSFRYSRGYGDAGSLKLDVRPKQTEVFVDGYLAGTAADFGGIFQSLDVSPGGHTITLWHQGYRTVTQDVHVQRGNQVKLRHDMEGLAPGEPQDARPMPSPESLVARGREDARLQDDQPWPPSRRGRPLPPARLAPPAEQAPPTRSATLSQTSDYSQLRLRVQPAGAQVLIDGEAWQGSGETGQLSVHLTVGVHHLEIKKDGFTTFKTDVQIRAGESTTLNVSLSGQEGQ